jgi:hypothetical protein
MRLKPESDAVPRRRGRKILIALLIFLPILLPLYLWPLRGGMTGPPGAAALSGSPPDPRNAGEVARIPGDVWGALMGRTSEPPSAPPPKPPRNLTMIAQLEGVAGVEALDVMAGPRDPRMTSLLDDEAHSFENKASGDGSPSSPVHFLAAPSSGEQGTGNGWDGFGSGGYPGLSNLGPWGGGGPGGRGRGDSLPASSGPTWNPGDPGSPAPTPEPATILLVGSNLALLGTMAWKRGRRREETDLTG